MSLHGRVLHTMIHVKDFNHSISFYTDVLGMRVLRKGYDPSEARHNAFLGYASEDESAVIELTAYEDGRAYTHGDAFGHLALGFDDVKTACHHISTKGGTITREPYVIASGKTIAMIVDPDGYIIELVQPAPNYAS